MFAVCFGHHQQEREFHEPNARRADGTRVIGHPSRSDKTNSWHQQRLVDLNGRNSYFLALAGKPNPSFAHIENLPLLH
jgi:hypothetical protein